MLPDWLKKPEMIAGLVLYLTAPLWGWFVGRARSWYASRSESGAQQRIEYLRHRLCNPPTLAASIAVIVCFLPLPFAIAMCLVTIYLAPHPPPALIDALSPVHREVRREIAQIFLVPTSFCIYALFGLLTVHGIRVAFWLRDGEEHFADNYKAGIQKRIDKLKKKYPRLK
jgi:hypothetical protein